ncbi:PREDICTED: transcription factor LHW-like [Nelumbo nucifera]|uniref:Transcription factor LHW-like n=2 Tax=Nelumbo nucifera TaxID=4432 RepID=A0A1U8Q4D8_NELNU|nr:PREDICTED: transcription factor LHW-like [Nelumbo nucifera]XP_019053476.1 PREDICTED: transcription factor LHW-like [Nelumbo nucifera]XP_019053477.1 PREDICTED: transcription factor LHW-like [Nelumbo nucifera]DAD43408.1 TPA_asm: hypothetical protein HUJ06_001638 [Nelumbo nucifera]
MNDDISESGIFSESGADHLLDAVVSKVHSSAKQNSDDNASCRTTLTKISSSAVPTESFTYSWVDQSDQRKVEMFGVPPPPSKSECSIDALLERTIKHMLFLQSVTKHADKLKQTGKSKTPNSPIAAGSS